jgi:aldehyde dehydrogenase (NAD+)
MYQGKNYVNSIFKSHRGDTFQSFNPSTEEPIGEFPQSTENEVNDCVEVARDAFHKWKSISRVKRADYFDKLCQVLKVKTEEITRAISVETGKSLNESRAEVIEALHMAQYCFGKGREPSGEIVSSELEERDSYVIRKPKGVVAVIAPWNFPFAIGGFWCAGPALLEGNTVVFKPSELTPMIGQLTAELYHEAGFPPGVFNLVHGDGQVGDWLARGKVDHVAFTGSAEVGQHIRKVCADSWHKTSSCEMGSKSAVIVFDDCDLDLAVSAALNSAFKLSGQRCVSAGRFIVQETIFDKFKAKFLEQVDKALAVDPFVPTNGASITFGPLISNEQKERVLKFNQLVRDDKDATVLFDRGNAKRPGYFLEPFVYQVNWGDKPYLKQEVFGPHVAIVPFKDADDAIRIYNDTEYGLAVGILTNDFRKARKLRDNCDFGLGYWNGGSIAAESHLPFGGVKKSGNGFPSAAGMFDAVVHKVSWSVNHGGLSFPQGLK